MVYIEQDKLSRGTAFKQTIGCWLYHLEIGRASCRERGVDHCVTGVQTCALPILTKNSLIPNHGIYRAGQAFKRNGIQADDRMLAIPSGITPTGISAAIEYAFSHESIRKSYRKRLFQSFQSSK